MHALHTSQDDEIDLKELFITLWQKKIIILFACSLALIAAVIHLHSAERTYLIKAVYRPVTENAGGPNLSGFGGLASLAGISLPSSSDSDFLAFQTLLTSEEVADVLMNDKDTVRSLFGSEWNDETQKFAPPPPSRSSNFKRLLKKALTGKVSSEYIPPNAQRLSVVLKKMMAISVDKSTGYLIISAETANTQLGIHIFQQSVLITDKLLKSRYIESAESTLNFYQKKITSARSREQREALAKLMAQEDQKLMLAARGKSFVVEPLLRATTSINPISPKASLILILSIVLGGFFGAAFILVRAASIPHEEK